MKEMRAPSTPGTQPTPVVDPNTDDWRDRLRFETLLNDVLARLCTVTRDRVDQEILEALRQVCEALGLDISAAWQWSTDEPDTMLLTHLYRSFDGPPVPDRMDAAAYHPWALQEALAGRVIMFSDSEDVPPEAEADREVWRTFDIKSVLCLPLTTDDGRVFGAVSFHDIGKTRDWDEALVGRLTLIAKILASTIVRTRAEKELRRSELRLSLATESAGAGVWSLNLETERFWLTEHARTLFGYAADDEVSFESFTEMVHPDDRPQVRQILDDLVRTGLECQVEYRIRRADGTERWMSSRGRVQQNVPDEAAAVLMGVTVDVTDRKLQEMKLHGTLVEVRELRDRLAHENVVLREQIKSDASPADIVGESEVVRRMLADARNVAPTDTAVLITGETGTGKELLAQAIHDLSGRRRRPLVKVNCAALPAPLIESELFGREKGAYTGAVTRQIGRFEVAHRGTLMLDEIGDLPIELQAKLLRVLQDGTFERLGSTRSIRSDVRIIAATNRDLAVMVAEGSFREDLFHRLNVFPIDVPPLRERPDDIPRLVWSFVQEFNARMGRAVDTIPRALMEDLRRHPWPGNVRELRNAIERAMIVSRGRSLVIDLPRPTAGALPRLASLEEVERRHISDVLDQVHWRISGKGGAAAILGMPPTTLHSRLKKLGIARPDPAHELRAHGD